MICICWRRRQGAEEDRPTQREGELPMTPRYSGETGVDRKRSMSGARARISTPPPAPVIRDDGGGENVFCERQSPVAAHAFEPTARA
jgi:hypothetical protein